MKDQTIKSLLKEKQKSIQVDPLFQTNLGKILQNQIDYLQTQKSSTVDSNHIQLSTYEAGTFLEQSLPNSSVTSEPEFSPKLPSSSRSKKSIFNFKNLFISSFVLLAILIISLTISQLIFQENGGAVAEVEKDNESPLVAGNFGNVEIKSQKILDNEEIPTDSTFVLKTENKTNIDVIRKAIKVEPAVGFVIESKTENEFLIRPEGQLVEGQVYVFKLANTEEDKLQSWAFQVKNSFKVNFTTPRNKATLVDPRSAVEIELSSSNIPDDIRNYIKMTPEVDYKIEVLSKLIIIKPINGFEASSVYTITLKGNLADTVTGEALQGGDYTIQFETNSVYDPNVETDSSYIQLQKRMYEYPVGENIVLDMYPSISYNNTPSDFVRVNIYSYKDASDFEEHLFEMSQIPVWSYYRSKNFVLPRLDQEIIRRYDSVALTPNDPRAGYLNRSFTLPDQLPQGNYLVEVDYLGKYKTTSFLQITNLSAYYNSSPNKTLFWVNKLNPEANLSDKATIKNVGTGEELGGIDLSDDGVLVVDTPKTAKDLEITVLKIIAGPDEIYIALTANDKIYRDYYGYYNYSPNIESSQYWNYLYLDKEAYAQTDTVNIFGVIDPRNGDDVDWKEVKVHISFNNGTSGQSVNAILFDENYSLVTQKVKPEKNNTFTAKIELNEFRSNYYSLTLTYKGNIISTKSLAVRPYDLPPYKIEAKVDSAILQTGKTQVVSGQIKTYGGTPASNLPLNIRWIQDSMDTRTDENGNFRAEFLLPLNTNLQDYFNRFQIYNEIVNITTTNLDEGELFYSVPFLQVNSDVYMNIEKQYSSEASELGIHRYLVKIDEIDFSNNEKSILENYNRPPVKGQGNVQNPLVDVKVSEYRSVKTQIGTNYNYILKTNDPVYEYSSKLYETRNFSYELNQDGEGYIDIPFSPEPNSYLDISFSTRSKKGNIANEKLTAAGQGISVFSSISYRDRAYLKSNLKEDTFFDESSVELSFKSDFENIIREGNKYLLVKKAGGFKEYSLSDNSNQVVEISNSDAPNVFFSGVVFNGRTYFIVKEYELRYQARDKELSLTITSDKSFYNPRDKAKFVVEVNDPVDGAPIPNATVNLVVVDQAVRDLESSGSEYGGFGVDNIFKEVYKPVLPGNIDENATHYIPDSQNQLGGKGSLGGGEPRTEFDDNPGSFIGITDTEGRVEINVSLPDNITTWEIYAQAFVQQTSQKSSEKNKTVVTSLPMAGATKINVEASRDYIVDAVIADKYLIDDKPEIVLQSSTKLKEGNNNQEEVSYSILIESLGITEEEVITGKKIGEQVFYPLPDLLPGKHNITISGKTVIDGNEYSDAIVKSFFVESDKATVFKSSLPEKLSTDFKPQYISERGDNAYFDVVITNSSTAKYYNSLSLFNNSNLARFESRLSSKISEKLLTDYFGETKNRKNYSLTDFVIDREKVIPTVNADSSLELTVMATRYAPEILDLNLTKSYLKKIYFDQSESYERQAIALFGLASLDESVIDGINFILKQEDELTIKARLYLILALDEVGDSNKAKSLAKDLFVLNSKDVSQKQKMIVNSVAEEDLVLDYELTKLALVISGRLGLVSDGELMLTYLENNPSLYSISDLERAIYLGDILEISNPKSGSVDISYGGSIKNYKIQNNQVVSLSLQNSATKLQDFIIEKVTGDLSVSIHEYLPAGSSNSEQSEIVSIQKRYFVNGIETEIFNSSDLVKVVLTYSIPANNSSGCYQITDYLPSGLVLLSIKRQIINDSYDYQKGGDNVNNRSYLIFSSTGEKTKLNACVSQNGYELVYYARAINRGTFTDSGAFILEIESNKFATSAFRKVEVR